MNIENLLPKGWELLEAKMQKDGMVWLSVRPPTKITSVDGVGGLRRVGDMWMGSEEPEDIASDLETLEQFRVSERSPYTEKSNCMKIWNRIKNIEYRLKHTLLSEEEVLELEAKKRDLERKYVECREKG